MTVLTIHIVNDVPYSNLNRDDSGTPKRTIQGGVERGLLSSQSIKRAVRKDYEARILELYPDSVDQTIRSRNLVDWAVARANEIRAAEGVTEELDEKQARAFGNLVLKNLTGGEETVTLLSVEELEVFASQIAHNFATPEMDEIFAGGKRTGSLAIAAFGRMFANAFDKVTDAAIAVSPAVAMHGTLVETDYFITADDYVVNDSGRGAAHLGTALYTSGVFYRSVTIDIEELKTNWTGFDGKLAEASLTQLVRSIIHSLPTGKKNSTAPYVYPPLVVAEVQAYRSAYSVEKPVKATDNGFLEPAIENLRSQIDAARKVYPQNYGETFVSGTASLAFDESVAIEELISGVVRVILDKGSNHAASAELAVEAGE